MTLSLKDTKTSFAFQVQCFQTLIVFMFDFDRLIKNLIISIVEKLHSHSVHTKLL
jgi:hypothetical protein